MSRKLSLMALFLLVPVQLMAGGPPRLCLPIDGVTAENAQACAKLLTDGLDGKRGTRDAVEIQRRGGQSYAMLYFNVSHLKLSDIDAALEGSGFSIPRDRLHLFGRIALEIEVGATATDALLRDLGALEYVKVDKSKREEGVLLVSLIMPYDGSRDIFKTLSSPTTVSTRSPRPTTASGLPSYKALRDVMAKHNASPRDIRWKCWGCRMLGGVAVAEPAAEARTAIAK